MKPSQKMTLKIEGQSFLVEVWDVTERPIRVMVDGEEFAVWPEEAVSAIETPLPARAASQAAPVVHQQAPVVPAAPEGINKARIVAAPIPGVIISISVKEGDTVSFGQELCTLEAMKMKNHIRANRAGTVAAVCTAVGDQVHQNQVLIEYTN